MPNPQITVTLTEQEAKAVGEVLANTEAANKPPGYGSAFVKLRAALEGCPECKGSGIASDDKVMRTKTGRLANGGLCLTCSGTGRKGKS